MKINKNIFICVLFVSLNFIFAQVNTEQAASEPIDTTTNNNTHSEYKSADEAISDEEFRRGVQAFYRGAFNEAILQFEKALSYRPQNNMTLEWMGKAYYKSGLEATALDTWQRVIDAGYGGLLLPNKLAVVKERRVRLARELIRDNFTEAGSFYGTFNNNLIFAGPTGVAPNADGSIWVAGYSSNELLRMDVNGYVVDRITGPLNGFDHPLDIIKLDSGNMLISETAGDRLCLVNNNGKFIKYISNKGVGMGQVVSPLYMAQDSHGNIFVTDYGNRRIDVFDKDGTPLFFFGTVDKFKNVALGEFAGLKGPTGIAITGDVVFVADDWEGCIYQFDVSGNFIRTLIEPGTFRKPESLKVWQAENSFGGVGKPYLVLCDLNKVYSIDIDTGAYYENVNTGNAPARAMSAMRDANGNVIVTDYKSNEIYVMAKMQDIIGGLFVQIEKVDASKFPAVNMTIKVEDRNRRPIVGLKEKNFYITESKGSVLDCRLLGAVNNNDWADITLLIDRSEYSRDFCENGNLDTAVRTIAAGMNNFGVLRIVSAGEVPTIEYTGSPEGATLFNSKALRTPISNKVALDAAIRLCTNDLIKNVGKHAIVILGAGVTTAGAFDNYSLSQTTTYLNNNCVSCLFVSDNTTSDESYRYIIENTTGGSYYLWQTQGLSSIISDIVAIPSGIYTFSYTSQSPNNFGNRYIPAEVETYLLNRSGRDESGYYSPLE